MRGRKTKEAGFTGGRASDGTVEEVPGETLRLSSLLDLPLVMLLELLVVGGGRGGGGNGDDARGNRFSVNVVAQGDDEGDEAQGRNLGPRREEEIGGEGK